VSCAKTAESTDRDAVWNAESGGSMAHVSHGDVDAPTRRGTCGGVWSIEKHCKA